jgi:hypothetical protein
VFENRVLRRIFGPKRDVTGGWKKLHNEELHFLYVRPIFITLPPGINPIAVKKTIIIITCTLRQV